jgi:GGDEF domain-containing protein
MLSRMESNEGQLVLGVIRDITERKQLDEEMRHLALTDCLTGLGNYRRLQDGFETEKKWFKRAGRLSALLLLDLDGR